MYYEKFLSQEVEEFSGGRCVACGEIVDEVILKNRNGGLKAVKMNRVNSRLNRTQSPQALMQDPHPFLAVLPS
jgi:hypothetical protein